MVLKNNDLKHWLVLIVCCGLAASSIGICINASGVFYTPVADGLGVLKGTFALHMTIFSLTASFVTLMIPNLIKKFKFKLLLFIGVMITVISTMLMAYVDSIEMFYLLGGLKGAGSALFSIVPITMIINQWFEDKHGLATSIALSFSGVAGAIFSPVLAYCITVFGWQNTYLITGVITLLLCLPAMIYPFSFNPRDDGLLPYGAENNKTSNVINKEGPVKFNFIQLTFIGVFFLSIFLTAITGITQHLPSFTESIGFNPSFGAMLVSAVMFGNISSKLIFGFISDYLGVIKSTIIMILINIIAILIMLIVDSSTLLVFGSFLFGSVYGLGAVGVALITRYFFGVENYSKTYPIISFATGIGGAFSLSLIGYIYDFMGSYSYAFIIALIFQVINLIILFIINVSKNKNKTTEAKL